MRTRDFRRHQTKRHMWRRLKEDRNQHYKDLDCRCWYDPVAMAQFKEQPKDAPVTAAAISVNTRATRFRSGAQSPLRADIGNGAQIG